MTGVNAPTDENAEKKTVPVQTDEMQQPPTEERPRAYLPQVSGYESEHSFSGTRRRRADRGFGSVLTVQSAAAAALGAAAWASLTFGSDAVKEVCTHLTGLFR